MTRWNDRQSCLSCGASDLKVVREEKNTDLNHPVLNEYLKEKTVLAQCAHCDLAFVQKIPDDPRFYEALYADTRRDVSVDFYHSGKRRIFAEVKSLVLRYRQTGRLLDIGAGTGVLLHSFAPEFAGIGIELGKAAREFAQSLKLQVVDSPLGNIPFPEAHFELVTLIDVLEHLTDPQQMVQEIHRVLKPGGLLYIKVPNYRAQALKQDLLGFLGLSDEGIMTNYVHINHYSPRALAFFLQKQEFEILEKGFSEPEIWDLSWKEAPKPFFHRLGRNLLVITLSKILKFFSRLSGQSLGFNHHILVRKRGP